VSGSARSCTIPFVCSTTNCMVAPLLVYSSSRAPPRSTLFPYTTLFRSYSFVSVTELSQYVAGERATATPPEERSPEQEAFVQRRSEEHTSELQSREKLVCRLLLEKKKKATPQTHGAEPRKRRRHPS